MAGGTGRFEARAGIYRGLLFAAVLVLGGCGDRPADTAQEDVAGAETLPAPDQASGSVTGMPGEPGPGQVGPPQLPAIELPAGTAIDGEGNIVDLDGDGLPDAVDGPSIPPAPGELPSPPAASDGPGADEAVAVVRAYYDAINGGSYGRAYALWSDGGKASGQSPQQFADGFDDTAEVSVEVMPPGRIEPAAGSRYIEVPVALAATRDDGSIHRYVGAYVLRRAVVDGASAEQRAWRIASADIREVRP
ncbi:hypothetical protein [Lysobacter sp. F60174L2]|uniref:hypothetical protein n=1 Tax=Lysobacter sp. F60174L2 TaxID=3459295 RepID=UPI00403DD9F5